MKLQLALDEMNLVDALRFADKVAEHVDIIEVGTPFVMDEGMRGVREFHRFFPDKEILADLKIMDGGYLEASYAYEAGAAYATILGVSDNLTIEGALKAARDYDRKLVVDMICVEDLPTRIAKMEEIGVDILAVHTGADQQAAGREPIQDLQVMTEHAKKAQIAVAGGINSKTIDKYVALKPEIIIVGSAIGKIMTECKNMMAILGELTDNAKEVDNEQIEAVEKLITEAKRIFISGAGRSGFAARGFSNRLMHLGYTVYFVGEPTTPSIQAGDLLIVGSGSGNTASLVSNAKKAKSQGAKVATITMFPENTIGSMADAVITLPGVTKKCDNHEGAGTVQAAGSGFEQLSWITYDCMVMDLMRITSQSDDDLFARHANME